MNTEYSEGDIVSNERRIGIIDFVSGTIGGIVGVITGQPLDTIKVRLQSQSYASTTECFIKTIQSEGTLGLYKGMLPPVVAAGVVNAIVFGVYGHINYLQIRLRGGDADIEIVDPHVPSLKEVALSGFGAGLFQSAVVTPAEVLKCRLQTDHSLYKGPSDCFRKIYNEAGVKGIFKGLYATTLRDTPSFVSYFFTYEYCKRHVFRRANTTETSKVGQFLSGGIAGVMAWLVSYPMDVIKSRIQVDNLTNPKYKGIIDCAKQSYSESGIKIFFKGLQATLIRGFLVNGATFVAYEKSMKVLNKFR